MAEVVQVRLKCRKPGMSVQGLQLAPSQPAKWSRFSTGTSRRSPYISRPPRFQPLQTRLAFVRIRTSQSMHFSHRQVPSRFSRFNRSRCIPSGRKLTRRDRCLSRSAAQAPLICIVARYGGSRLYCPEP